MVDLRTPHERRSDQLSVLVRRPLTVASLVPRFMRTGQQNPAAQFRFDDFDSDADTEVNSGRLRRSSSASVLSLPSDSRLTPPSTMHSRLRKSAPPASPPTMPTAVPVAVPPGGRRPLAVIVDAPLGMGNFDRSRAKSFYGKAQDVAGDAPAAGASAQRVGEGPSAIDETKLREELGEDYALFAPRRRDEKLEAPPRREAETPRPTAAKPPKPPSPKCAEASNEQMDELHDEDSASASCSGSVIRERSATAPALRRWNTMGANVRLMGGTQDDDASSASSESKRGANIVRRLVSATTPRVALGLKPRRSQRRSRSEAHEHAVRFDPELTARADELRKLIVDTRAASAPPTGTPLFVEEAGRPPRVAFVDGDIKRVRVRDREQSRATPRHGLRSSMRFNIRRRRLSRSSARLRKRKMKSGKGFAQAIVHRMQKADRKLRKRRYRNEDGEYEELDAQHVTSQHHHHHSQQVTDESSTEDDSARMPAARSGRFRLRKR